MIAKLRWATESARLDLCGEYPRVGWLLVHGVVVTAKRYRVLSTGTRHKLRNCRVASWFNRWASPTSHTHVPLPAMARKKIDRHEYSQQRFARTASLAACILGPGSLVSVAMRQANVCSLLHMYILKLRTRDMATAECSS